MSALFGHHHHHHQESSSVTAFNMIRHEDAAGDSKPQSSPTSRVDRLQRERQLKHFAASLNNVGGLLYQKGDSLVAMQCLQEAVQTLMLIEDPSNNSIPSETRQKEISDQLRALTEARSHCKKEQDQKQQQQQQQQQAASNNNNKKAAIPPLVAARTVASASSRPTMKKATPPAQQQILEEEDSKPPARKRAKLSGFEEEKKMPAAEDVAAHVNGVTKKKHAPPPLINGVKNNTNTDGMISAAATAATTTTTKEPLKVLSKTDASEYKGEDLADDLLDGALDEATVLEPTDFSLGGIPGLFGMTSKMRGAEKKAEESMLVFSEPYLILLDDNNSNDVNDNNANSFAAVAPKDGPDAGAFYVPLDQCSRASLFNMGLIHYQWKSIDSAVQFFELSVSLAQPEPSLLKFDPLILACVNNIGQIHLQKGQVDEAKGMFSDALSRGNSALVQLYGDEGLDSASTRESCQSEVHKLTSRMLRRFLVRTLMNMGFVHFFNCEYELALRTCLDAMRLLRPNMLELDAAALWYNIALSHHHKNELREALEYLDKFLDVACRYLGVGHLQVASALHRKGLICFEMGNLYKSTKPVLQALRIRKSNFGRNHLLVAESLCLAGKIYLDREEFRFARNALEQALKVQKALNQGDSLCLDIAQTLIDLARAYHSQGRLIDSLKSYTEVKALTKRMFGERHPYVARMQKIIGNIYLEQGKVDEAVFMFENAMIIHVEQGLPIDFAVVQNPHVRVNFQHHPTAATA